MMNRALIGDHCTAHNEHPPAKGWSEQVPNDGVRDVLALSRQADAPTVILEQAEPDVLCDGRPGERVQCEAGLHLKCPAVDSFCAAQLHGERLAGPLFWRQRFFLE